MKSYSMDDILKANLGESTSKIVVSFKKTIQVEQFNPEVVQIDCETEFTGKMSGIERATIASIIQSQIEYEAFAQMAIKGLINSDVYNCRKASLIASCNAMLQKYEELTGESSESLMARFENSKKE